MALSNGDNPTTSAKFDSECPGCFEQINAGDIVTLTGEGWVCPDCAHDIDPLPGGRPPRQPAPQTDLDAMGY